MPSNFAQTISLSHSISRRAVLAIGLASAAPLRFRPFLVHAERQPTWHTWLIKSADELRPSEPPAPSQGEIDELLGFRDARSVERLEVIERWNTGPAPLPWTNLALDLIKFHKPSPVRTGRALALLHAAVNDAALAAADARTAHPRPNPQMMEPEIQPMIEAEGTSFPSEHAAIAGAAEVVLPYLFSNESAGLFSQLSEEATNSRLWAGVNFRSDIETGLEIGRAVGKLAVERGKADGSDAEWEGSNRPTGEGYWEPTPPGFIEEPLDPLAGTWKTWVLERGNQLRPPSPPAHGSPSWESELLAVQDAVANRTKAQEDAINFWAGLPGTVTPGGLWNEIARDLIVRDKLSTSNAANVLAMMNVAVADAFICCWDAKYTYWMARPITADPTLDTLIPTPPFPTYTSGHSTISAAAATVLAYLFPADAESLLQQAEEAKNSRLWSGIHFPIDNDMGATGGAQVGRLVIAMAAAG